MAYIQRFRRRRPDLSPEAYLPAVSRRRSRLQRGQGHRRDSTQSARTRYAGPIEILVVDDGSSRRHRRRARRAFISDRSVAGDRRRRTAARRARSTTGSLARTGEIIVGLDADTIFDPTRSASWSQPLGESARRRSGRQREGRQSHQSRDALAGARVRHESESRSARVRAARLHHRRPGRCRRVAEVGYRRRRAAFGRTRWPRIRISRSPSSRGMVGELCRFGDRVYRGARHAARTRQAALPLVVRNAPVRVEAPRRSLSSRRSARSGGLPFRACGSFN